MTSYLKAAVRQAQSDRHRQEEILPYKRTKVLGHWDFATKGPADCSTAILRLFRAMTIAITRHVKVRGPANPFDPAWTTYFTRRRRAAKRSVRLSGATP